MSTSTTHDLLILGAGAAGLIAAIAAAEHAAVLRQENPALPSLSIAILEKNPQPGIKILVCGGGRCNFTNAGPLDFLIARFGRNGRFLTPALRHLSNDDLRAFFARLGVPSHEEHDGKIYPDSNSARSVVNALVNHARDLGVQIFSGSAASYVTRTQDGIFEVNTSAAAYTARALLLAVGGMSYQRMGTTGDGYQFAQALGHSIVTPRPAIVGLLCKEEWPKTLQGLALQNVEVTVELPANRKAKIDNRKSPGDLLFTHFGLSGPAILNPSEIVAELLETAPDGEVFVKIDFAPRFSHDALAALFRQWQQHHGKRFLRNQLSQNAREITITSTSPDQTWSAPQLNTPPAHTSSTRPGIAIPGSSSPPFSLPARLSEKLLDLAAIPQGLPCAHLSSPQIHRLIEFIKSTRLALYATRGFKEAMVTAGGVALAEVDPQTLASRRVPGLYLAGEILDLTGPSGGYNLQLAFSTGHLAGTAAAEALLR